MCARRSQEAAAPQPLELGLVLTEARRSAQRPPPGPPARFYPRHRVQIFQSFLKFSSYLNCEFGQEKLPFLYHLQGNLLVRHFILKNFYLQLNGHICTGDEGVLRRSLEQR